MREGKNMVSTVEDLDTRALQFLAQCDENTGPPAQRGRVISARAELAQRHIPMPRAGLDLMLDLRARAAINAEHADPAFAIVDRALAAGYDPDDDEDRHILDNPPQRP
jgi:hypothetical protein